MGLFTGGQTLNDAINMRVYTCAKRGVVRVRMRVRKVYVSRSAKIVVCPKMKNEWNKWKNHFYEMKGDVGMSLHEKERNRKKAFDSVPHRLLQQCDVHPTPLKWIYSRTSEQRTLWEHRFCPLFGGCPYLGGSPYFGFISCYIR